MSIGKKLKELRSKSSISLAECSRYLGVSQSTYRDWENGRAIRGEPYIKIARLFKTSLSELFGMKNQDLLYELSIIESELNRIVDHVENIRSRL